MFGNSYFLICLAFFRDAVDEISEATIVDVNRVVTIEVRGMTCHRCVDNIQTKVRDKPGINNIEVSK